MPVELNVSSKIAKIENIDKCDIDTDNAVACPLSTVEIERSWAFLASRATKNIYLHGTRFAAKKPKH